MFAACLLVGLFTLPPSSVLLFSPLARRASGRWATALAAAGLAGLAVGAAVGLGAVFVYALIGGLAVWAGSVAWTPLTRSWGAVGRLAWGSAVVTGVLYLAYMLEWTFRSRLGPVGTVGGLLLWRARLPGCAVQHRGCTTSRASR